MKTLNRASRRSRRAPMAEINVTPLVDVMLVLLIIFMVAAPLLKAGVPVQLPGANAKPLPNEAKVLTLSLTREGGLYLDDAQISEADLPTRLAALPQGADGPPQVSLRADKALDYGRVMAVMGELNHAGFNRIALITSGSVTPSSSPQP